MIRALAVAGFLCLAACVTSQAPPKQFDLGQVDAPARRSGVLAANIIIPDVMQPSWIRTRDIFYRLDYEPPARPQRYAMSQWVATPAELVTLRLRQAVQSANAGFTLPTSNGSRGYVLQASIDEFTQAFTSQTTSKCVLQLRASLWRADGQIVAQKEFHLEVPAPTPDASGAARCLAAAVDAEDEQIVEWLSALPLTVPALEPG
jgi:cholesterol transport system auxiliary component